jgi:hypothetical protein
MSYRGYDSDETLAPGELTRVQSKWGGCGPWLWVGIGVVVLVLCLVVAAAVGGYFFLLPGGGAPFLRQTPSAVAGTPQIPGGVPQVPGGTPQAFGVTPQVPGGTLQVPTGPVLGETPGVTPGATEEATQEPTPGEGTLVIPGGVEIPTISLTPGASPAAGPTLGPITFASGVSDSNEPVNPGTSFSATVKEIYAFFDYSGMADGMTVERVWYLNDEETARGSDSWTLGESGTTNVSLYTQSGTLNPGTYKLELYVDGELLQSGTFTIEKAGPVPSKTPKPPVARAAKITYAAWDGGKYQIHVMNIDGSGDAWLVGPGDGPSWKPDGSLISFYGEEGISTVEGEGGNGLWVVATEGADKGKVAKYIGDANIRYTQWSPDGTRIAYDSQRGGGPHQIYVCEVAKGPNACESWGPQGEFPAWNPGSDKIVYRNCDEGRCTLGTVNIVKSAWDQGSKVRIPNTDDDFFPAWSPDGKYIAFARKQSNSNFDIYIIKPDGSGLKQLTDDPALDVLPAWTPDERIVFRSSRGGSWGIYIVNSDGSGQKKINDAMAGPDWGRAGLSAIGQ